MLAIILIHHDLEICFARDVDERKAAERHAARETEHESGRALHALDQPSRGPTTDPGGARSRPPPPRSERGSSRSGGNQRYSLATAAIAKQFT